jgi:hypothetical protein
LVLSGGDASRRKVGWGSRIQLLGNTSVIMNMDFCFVDLTIIETTNTYVSECDQKVDLFC